MMPRRIPPYPKRGNRAIVSITTIYTSHLKRQNNLRMTNNNILHGMNRMVGRSKGLRNLISYITDRKTRNARIKTCGNAMGIRQKCRKGDRTKKNFPYLSAIDQENEQTQTFCLLMNKAENQHEEEKSYPSDKVTFLINEVREKETEVTLNSSGAKLRTQKQLTSIQKAHIKGGGEISPHHKVYID